MIAETKHCLRNLANFQGRDSRQTFWYYIVALIILQFGLGMVLVVPLMASMMGNMAQVIQSNAPPDQMGTAVFAQMGPMMKGQMQISGVLGIVVALLFIAAFVRRLHDSDKPGWIALVPLATVAAGQYYMFTQLDPLIDGMMAAMESNNPQQVIAFEQRMRWINLLAWAGYLVVIVFGAMKSTPGPNRYGEAPHPV